MLNIIQLVLKFLGFTSDNSKTNTTAGIINYAWMLPALGWVWLRRTETIVFQIVLELKGKNEVINLFSTTYFGLTLVILIIFGYVEINRRSP